MARNTESIERDIEAARDQLASTLDELSVRANPKRIVESTKASVIETLNTPAVKFSLIGAGVVVAALVVRSFLN